jgi:hypothetical protein
MAITLHHFKQVTALMKKNKHNIPLTKDCQEIK